MKPFRVASILLGAIFCMSATVFSQETISPQKQVLMDELIANASEVDAVKYMVENYLQGIGQSLIMGIAKQGTLELEEGKAQEEISEAYSSKLENIQNFFETFKERIDFESITRKVYYAVYDAYYSEEDLQAMVDFSRSPETNLEAWENTSTAKKYKRVENKVDRSRKLKLVAVLDPLAIGILEELDLGGYYPSYKPGDIDIAYAESLK